MVDAVNFDMGCPLTTFDQEENSLPPTAALSAAPVEEVASSFRSSQRRLRGSHISINLTTIRRESAVKPVQKTPILTPALNEAISLNSNTDNISADLRKYFFDKMEKKGIYEAEKIYDQYLKAGCSPKAAIALTDRKFFPKPHEKDHGNYLKNVIGDELFKKEQAARKGKNDWIADEKIHTAAIRALEAKSKTSSDKSKKHKYTQQQAGIGGYLLGIGEILLGGTLMVTGCAIEIGSFGALTVGVAFQEAAGLALIGDGFARTMREAQDISVPKLPKYDPLLDIVNKPKEKPRKWNEPGSPPIRGDHILGDGSTSPYPGFDQWKGKGDPSSGKGSWRNPETGQSLHPDLNHPSPEKPHWDYEGHPGFPGGAKLYPDGTWVPK